jgi:hypothetical protein
MNATPRRKSLRSGVLAVAKLEFFELTAPESWASYLINGDASGLSDEEEALCDEWVESVGAIGPVDCSEEPEFRWTHDAFNVMPLGATCLTYTFQRA